MTLNIFSNFSVIFHMFYLLNIFLLIFIFQLKIPKSFQNVLKINRLFKKKKVLKSIETKWKIIQNSRNEVL